MYQCNVRQRSAIEKVVHLTLVLSELVIVEVEGCLQSGWDHLD